MPETYYDPLRRKEVAATPEEQVRQWFIVQLRDLFKIPLHMMASEVGFKFGEKQYRSDILVYDREAQPLAVVECKRPDVELSEKTVAQAMRYNAVLSVKYIILTNGKRTLMFRREGQEFRPLGLIPTYEEMVG